MAKLYSVELFGVDIGFSYFNTIELIDVLGLKAKVVGSSQVSSLVKKHGSKHRIVGIAMRQVALSELKTTLNSKFLPYDPFYQEGQLRSSDRERQYESEEKLLYVCWSLASAKSVASLRRLYPEFTSRELREMYSKGKSVYRYFRQILNDNTRDYVTEYKQGNTDRADGGDLLPTIDNSIEDEVGQARKEDVAMTKRSASGETTAFEDEVVVAIRLLDFGVDLISEQVVLVKQGKPLDFDVISAYCSKLVASYERNPYALLAVRHIKRDESYLAQHVLACAVLACHLAKALQLEQRYVDVITAGALLFDLGRFKLPDSLRNKSGKLSEEEFSLMRKHIHFGESLLRLNPNLPKVVYLMLQDHHERIDGAGYPNGKEGEEISVYGKIGAIVDAYDALTSYQVYRAPMTPTMALEGMAKEAGLAFDQKIFSVFRRSLGEVPVGSCIELSNGRVAFVLTLNKQCKPSLVRQVYSLSSRTFISPADLPFDRTDDIELVRVLLPSDYGLQFVDHLS